MTMAAKDRTRSIRTMSGRAFTGTDQWGYVASVDAAGVVSVYDSIAGYYTTCHALTERQMARIRRLAD